MKHLLFLIIIMISMFSFSFGQEETITVNDPFFKKEHLFTGGTLNLGFGNNSTSLGASPYFGYSLNRFLDVAGSIGINYFTQRDNIVMDDRLRQNIFTPGAFVRLFPIKFLFAQLHYEKNLINYHYIPALGSTRNDDKQSYEADCWLGGVGISNGKNFDYQKSYYYFSILWDLGDAYYSPYKDNLRRNVPIIRAGYHIALFQKK
jgi:hypothetical protein